MDQDPSITPLEVDTAEDKKIGDKEAGVGKVVKLRAYNLFASRIRDSIKDENPVANGHEIKRIVGQKWAQLDYMDKQEFFDVAQNEYDMIEKLPVDPNAPKRRRRRRTKAEIEMDDGSGGKKRRGRPRKAGDGTNGDASDGEEQPKRRRVRKKGDAAGKAVDPAYVGKSSGNVDGSFDAGYLVTVRIGDTDLVFRGVIFEPSTAMLPNNVTAIGPGLKLVRRNDGILFPSTGHASSSKQILGGPGLASGSLSLVK